MTSDDGATYRCCMVIIWGAESGVSGRTRLLPGTLTHALAVLHNALRTGHETFHNGWTHREKYVGRWLSVFEALLRHYSTVSNAQSCWRVSDAQNCHIDLVRNVCWGRLKPPFCKSFRVLWAIVWRLHLTRRGRFLQKWGFSHATTLAPYIRYTLS